MANRVPGRGVHVTWWHLLPKSNCPAEVCDHEVCWYHGDESGQIGMLGDCELPSVGIAGRRPEVSTLWLLPEAHLWMRDTQIHGRERHPFLLVLLQPREAGACLMAICFRMHYMPFSRILENFNCTELLLFWTLRIVPYPSQKMVNRWTLTWDLCYGGRCFLYFTRGRFLRTKNLPSISMAVHGLCSRNTQHPRFERFLRSSSVNSYEGPTGNTALSPQPEAFSLVFQCI